MAGLLKKRIHVFPPALLVVLNIFLFGPFIIYVGNTAEFSVSLVSILWFYLIPAFILLFVLTGVGLMLPGSTRRFYVSLIFLIGVLIWIQGNLLVWKYGLLNGQPIEWSRYLWRGWIDGAVWVVFIALGVFLYKKIHKIAPLGSVALILLQTANLALGTYENPQVWRSKSFSSSATLDEGICAFSEKQNVIQIILDGFQSTVFSKIVEENMAEYGPSLEGFTFFKGTTGAFPTTRLSVPAFLSGVCYKNNIPMPDFVKSVYQGQNIIKTLYDAGYDIDLIGAVAPIVRTLNILTRVYQVPIPYDVSLNEYQKANSALMMDLVLFRVSPHFLKKYVFNNQLWLFQQLVKTEECAMTFYGAYSRFLDDFISRMAVNRDEPVYKYIHLENTHPPFVVAKGCKYAGKVLPINNENAKIQDKCALDQMIQMFQKLKQKGVYDNALIILQADHGIGLNVDMMDSGGDRFENDIPPVVVGGALPLLAIKPPQASGPLKISNVQGMLTDIPRTIGRLLHLKADFPGISFFKTDFPSNRHRVYRHHEWRNENWQADFLDRLDEYIIQGSVFEPNSWQKGVTYFPPDIKTYKVGKINFGTAGAEKFLRSGWGANERSSGGNYTFNWALGDSASIYVSLPVDKPVILSARMGSYGSRKTQKVSVKVDGHLLGSWILTDPWQLTEGKLVIPPNNERPSVSTIEFVFSHHRIPKGKERPVAVRFETITLAESNGQK